MNGQRHAFADGGGPLCGADRAPVHISTGPPSCPDCIVILEADYAARAELEVLVVVSTADDERPPGRIAESIKRTLAAAGEVVVYVEDLPAGVRILAPGERNGRA